MSIMKRLSIIVPLLFVPAVGSGAVAGGVESLRETGKAFASVAREVSPAVVFIQVETSRTGGSMQGAFPEGFPFGEEFFERFFGDRFGPGAPVPRGESPGRERRATGQGSGFVFARDDGLLKDKTYILTNNHVVEDADKITVSFKDGRTFEAEITGTDPQSDVAVIEIEAENIAPLDLADSSELEVGEWVVAIGNPFGLSHTLTVGVVSATGRTSIGINDYEDFIQTDAAINPGNSGGPLVNLNGEVVGINTAIFSRSGGYMGVGFAIPINLAQAIAEQLIDTGKVTRGYLGVVIQPLTPELAESFDIDATKGILVSEVADDSPAAAAGMKTGDVIVEYRGEAVDDIGVFRNRIALTAPGERAEFVIVRNAKRRKLSVTLGELSADKVASTATTGRADDIGVTVETLTESAAQRLGLERGVGVAIAAVEPGSVAAAAGLRPGMAILQVDRKAVASVAEFNALIRKSVADKRVLLLVASGSGQRFVALRW